MTITTTRRPRGRTVAASVVATLAVAVSGCTSDASADGDSYLVGFPALLTGPAAFAGVPITQGAELAAEEINESGFLGEGTTVDLEMEDVKSDPAQGIALYKQFAADGASGVLCCGLSAEAGALAPVMTQDQVPGIVTSAILDDIAEPPHLFRPHILPSAEGGIYDQFIDTVVPAEDIETAVIVVNGDNDAMVADGEVWKDGLERNGAEVVKTVSTNSTDTNFTGPATEIASIDPDAVVLSTLGTPSALMARALRERGYDKRLMSSYGVDSAELFDTSAKGLAGTLFAVPFHAEFSSNETATGFIEAYREKYDEEPDIYAAQGYTSMWFLAMGIKDSGTGDPVDVGSALSDIDTQDSVYGEITYVDGQATLAEPGSYLEWTEDGDLVEWTG